MTRFRRAAGAIALTAATALVFSACATSPEPAPSGSTPPPGSPAASTPSEPVTITFANWISTEEATIPAYNAMLDAFAKKYPEIKVENLALPYGDILNRMIVSSAGGEPPTVGQIQEQWLPALAATGGLQPLDELLGADVMADFTPSLLAKSKTDQGTMSVPWAGSPALAYWNLDLLKKAGHDAPPTTWDGLVQAGKDIAALGNNDAGQKIYGLGISDKKGPNAGYFLLPWLWAKGGDLLDADNKVVFDSDANAAALAEIKSFYDSGVAPKGVDIKDLRTLFGSGQLGVYFDIEVGIGLAEGGSLGLKYGEGADVIAAPIPGGRSFYVTHSFVEFAGATDAQKAAGAKLIDFLSGPEGIEIYNDNAGFKIAARSSSLQIPFYSTEQGARLKPFMEVLATAEPVPATNDQFNAAMETVADAIAQVENGADAKQVVATTGEALTGLYAK